MLTVYCNLYSLYILLSSYISKPKGLETNGVYNLLFLTNGSMHVYSKLYLAAVYPTIVIK
jgi:hypothetical protein